MALTVNPQIHLYIDLALAVKLYQLTAQEATAIVELGLTVGRGRYGMGKTVFLAPFLNVLAVLQQRRRKAEARAAALALLRYSR